MKPPGRWPPCGTRSNAPADRQARRAVLCSAPLFLEATITSTILMMPRIEPEDLRDPEHIYLASSVRAARKVEALLDSHGVSYVVQVEELGRTTLFGTMRQAAGFYVAEGQAEYCRSLIAESGMGHGIVDRGPDEEG